MSKNWKIIKFTKYIHIMECYAAIKVISSNDFNNVGKGTY